MNRALLPFTAVCAVLALSGCTAVLESERHEMAVRRVPPPVYQRAVRLQKLDERDIVILSRHGVAESTLIRLIYLTKSQYALDRADMNRLERAGVSGDVVAFMYEYESKGLLETFFAL